LPKTTLTETLLAALIIVLVFGISESCRHLREITSQLKINAAQKTKNS